MQKIAIRNQDVGAKPRVMFRDSSMIPKARNRKPRSITALASLVCDFQELYRHLIDDFLIERCQKLRKKDFVLVTDFMMHLKMGKKIHLKEYETDSLAEDLNVFFDSMVNVERIKAGNRQTIDSLISEEALLLAKYLRKERHDWTPRIPEV